MRGGRGRLPVLAEVSDFAPGGERIWSLRREDFERLTALRERLGEARCVLLSGEDGLSGALAIALAGAAAAAGLKTVLVECDLARPRLALDLGLAPEPGLHEYLRWEATPDRILQPLVLAGPAAGSAREPLAFVAAGRQAPEPATLLGLRSFEHMTEKLRGAYELVVLLGPALAAGGPGLAAIAARADRLLIAVGPSATGRRAARELGALARGLPVEPLGAVVVGAEKR